MWLADDGVPRCAPRPSGGVAARERQGALSQRAWWRSIGGGGVRTRFGEGGGKLNRRRTRGMLHSCARESQRREPEGF